MLCANKHLPFVCIVHLFIYLMDLRTWLKANINAFFERGLLCGTNPIRQNSSMVEHLFMISEIIVVFRKVNNHQIMKMEAGVQSWEDCSTAKRAKKRSILLQTQIIRVWNTILLILYYFRNMFLQYDYSLFKFLAFHHFFICSLCLHFTLDY